MDQISARPPPPKEIAKAFTDLVNAKLASKQALEDIQVRLALRSLRYLKEEQKPDSPPWLSVEILRKALWALQRRPNRPASATLPLADELYEDIKARQDTAAATEQKFDEDFAYLTILSLEKETERARTLLETTGNTDARNWEKVLEGIQRKDAEEEFAATLASSNQMQVPFTGILHARVVQFYSKRNDLEKAKKYYTTPPKGGAILPQAHSALLLCCAANNDLEFGQKVVGTLLEVDPTKEIWDVVFLWSAAIGKGVDELDRMMEVMKRRTDATKTYERPDIETINGLVEFAISRKDPYTAERYVHLGEKWAAHPNAKTFIMQMEYRLSVNDIDGARVAFLGLQGQEASDNEEVAVINKLIQAMCKSGRYDFDSIMGVADDLVDRKARFNAETICELSLLHLKRREFEDVSDLLQTHSYHCSSDQRITIRDVFVAFILDRANSVADTWDTYQILRKIFTEIPRPIRHTLMQHFFARGRSDMACHIFFHMKFSTDPTVIPDIETYAIMFVGIARRGDDESLELVHNQMKTDIEIEPNTKILTGLMMAYTATGRPAHALEIWRDITQSKEGPTYASIVAAFHACENYPFGERFARPLWEGLRRMDIEVTRDVFAAYVGALAGNGKYDEAEKLVLSAETTFGLTPDVLM